MMAQNPKMPRPRNPVVRALMAGAMSTRTRVERNRRHEDRSGRSRHPPKY